MAAPWRLRRVVSAGLLAAALSLSGCSLFGSVSPSPTPRRSPTTATATPGSRATSPAATSQSTGTRTVTAIYGLNVHQAASLSATVVATLVWGDTVTVLGYTAAGGPWPHSTSPGAWYHVQPQAQAATGWIVADPAYSAPGSLSSVSFADKDVDGVLIPDTWTWADDPGEAVMLPQLGTEVPTLVIRVAAGLNALGLAGLTGYSVVSSNSEVVACGYTGTEVDYQAAAGTTPQPTADAGGAKVTRLGLFVQFRATLSTSPPVAVDIEMNYSTPADRTVFETALSSIRFPFPLCEAPPSPSP